VISVSYHKPVLLTKSVEALNIAPEGTYADVTFGGGGHTTSILKKLGKKGRLIAFDQDEEAAANLMDDKRLTLVNHNFKYLKRFLRYYNAIPIDGLLADLGVSSHQFDESSRGFSIRFEATLDMRMNRQQKLSAKEVVATYSAEQLQRIFSMYGEAHNARTAAHRIVEQRKEKAINTVEDLKRALESCTPRGNESQYLAKIFQALRIEVNDELGALQDLLKQSAEVLKPGGRLVMISYHSLEDRLVKNFIQTGNFEGESTTDIYGNKEGTVFKPITKKPIIPTDEEIKENPRARSAKLRIAERTQQ
jgi:16S rRNA (cytosine1402-N4)-methyltransferase